MIKNDHAFFFAKRLTLFPGTATFIEYERGDAFMKRKTAARYSVLTFLTFCILLGVFLGLQHPSQTLHTRETEALGVTVLLGAQGKDAQAALHAAENEIERLDALFAYDGDGDIAQLNATGRITADADTVALLDRAKTLSALTDGAYNCTAAPLLDAWKLAQSADREPSADELEPLLALVDDSQIHIDGDTITIPDGVRVNVDSIARGYIADRVKKVFANYALERGFVTFGIDRARYASGDAGLLEGSGVTTYSTNQNDDAWAISIANPANPGRVIANYNTLDDAVFSAGTYQLSYSKNGRTYRRIIDPRTGQAAATGLASVTVVSDDSVLAAALSEALYVLGREDGIDLWDDHRIDFDAIFINDTGSATPTGRDITITAGIYQRDGASFSLIDDPGGASPLEKSENERATRII